MLANQKPWGYEFLAYQNENIAIWHLFLDPWQETSLHCHPNKKTGLIVLEGGAQVSFLSGKEKMFAGDKVMIRQGVFHRTKNMTECPLQLFEVETPVDKGDLVRIDDKYGRSGKSYGDEQTIKIEPPNYPWNTNNVEKIGSVYIRMVDLKENYFDYGDYQEAVFMILSGGLHSKGINILGAGDVISGKNLNSLHLSFSLIENTQALRIDL